MLDRLVTQIEPYPEDFEQQKPRPFCDFLDGHDIVLLGDPGSGKTHTFRHAAEYEGGDYRKVQQFVIFEGESSHGKTVYLDALDEFRSRRGDRSTVALIVRVVRALNRPKIRLSCRAADWLGNTDLAIFRELAHEKGLVVLRLEPLSEAQVIQIAQSRSIVEAQSFWTEATERGLEGLIGNPQTLIMLLDVVAGGVWPKTRKELYERSATLLLAESNGEHTREPLGKFEALELLEAAGAACALMLISDLPGLSLRENSLDAHYPSYRRVPCGDPQKVEAALCRRAFFSVGNEQVKYIHRTVAEFLAAKWLVARLQNGLPLGRIQSLICVEGVPAPELRGLYAWLATLSPEHAPALIAADPYGVLVYGDAASMPPSLRKVLLDALQRLARSDPWFRARDWTDKPLGGLSGSEMVEAFRAILSDRNSGLHLRSVVLDAIEHGPEVPELRDDLVAILADSNCPDTERLSALDGLLKVIPGGVEDLVKVYRNHFIGNRSTARLRAHILAELYPKHFTTVDVVVVYDDFLVGSEGRTIGELWRLSSAIPEKCLPEVINALCTTSNDADIQGRRGNEFEVASAFERMLRRFFASSLPKQPREIWTWLSALYRVKAQTVGSSSQDDIKKFLQDNQPLVLSMFDIVVEEAGIHEPIGLSLHDFLPAIVDGISCRALVVHIFDILEKKSRYDDKDYEIYVYALILCFRCEETITGPFEQLYMLGHRDPILRERRDALCICEISERRWKNAQRKLQNTREKLERQERDQQNLHATADSIRTGQHLHNLGVLAQRYFGIGVDSARPVSPVARLRDEIGDELTQLALEGFQAVLLRNDLPTPQHIAELGAKNRKYLWWYAILAGMDERWSQTRCLDAFSDSALEAVLCLQFALPTFEEEVNSAHPTRREWPDRILAERPNLAMRAFRGFLCPFFEKRASHISLLYELVNNEQTLPWRGELALELLEKFATPPPEALSKLLSAALSAESCRERLAELTKRVLTARRQIRGECRVLWMVTGFVLSPHDFYMPLKRYCGGREAALWTVKEFVEHVTNREATGALPLTIDQRKFLTLLIGCRFVNTYHPLGGTSGHRNDWNAADFARHQIDALSAEASLEAGEALVALAGNGKLPSYGDYLRHAIANQAKVRRQQQYEQPDWEKVVRTLQGGKPANIADLHALAIDHLKALRAEIRHSNVDTYKQFWRLSDRGSIERPQHEEICRDRLIELLRPRLSPLDVLPDPEVHMAADKRADIVLYYRTDYKLPIEVKRHIHIDLWTACANQLDRLYACDPKAGGFGIYLVFWFGEELGGQMPSPPSGGVKPNNAVALEEALRSLVPEDQRYCIDILVLDVTPPAGTKNRRRKR